MEKEYNAVSDGTYTLQEGDDNRLYFYREDGKVLGDVGRIPMDLYQAYVMQKMMTGEITDMVANNIKYETSDDGKIIRMTIFGIGEEDPDEKDAKLADKANEDSNEDNSDASKDKPNFLSRIIKKFFG